MDKILQKEAKLVLQAIKALKDSFNNLKKAYENENHADFENIKKSILELQKEINMIIK